MTRSTSRLGLVLPLAASAALGACSATGGHAGWSGGDALAAQSIEVQVDGSGAVREIEYHILPEEVPAAVHAAMDRLHPGGRATAAEKEYVDGRLHWELTKTVDGLEIEAMFLPDGTLHSEEVQVREGSVPSAVRSAARGLAGFSPTAWEEIRDGARDLVEYHVKGTRAGQKLKVSFAPDGAHLRTVREIEAEIEVPVEG